MAARKKTAKKLTNHIIFCLDTSGSMDGIKEDVRQAYNQMLRTVREQSEREGQSTFVSLVMFDSSARIVSYPTDVRNIQELSRYPVGGMTALFDGVGLGVSVAEPKDGENVSFLVLAYTDGGENSSLKYRTGESIRQLIADKQGSGNWTFAFQMPPGTGKEFARKYGIPEDNVREWEATTKGVREMEQSTTAGIGSYFRARGAGQQSVKSFYAMTTDLSKTTAKQVKKELDDVSNRFRVLSVDKEESIKEFVERKTNKPYIIGAAYYQLTKREPVQGTKPVLLMEKGKKAVWGGDEARDLVGLPTDGVTLAKVEPGNHGNFDIYVASTSVNRKLVRGTKLLLDVTKTKSSTPTWNHLAVTA